MYFYPYQFLLFLLYLSTFSRMLKAAKNCKDLNCLLHVLVLVYLPHKHKFKLTAFKLLEKVRLYWVNQEWLKIVSFRHELFYQYTLPVLQTNFTLPAVEMRHNRMDRMDSKMVFFFFFLYLFVCFSFSFNIHTCMYSYECSFEAGFEWLLIMVKL